MPLTTLHVYCGPFPSVQGTQTLIRQTCTLLSQNGHNVHMMCYASGISSYNLPFTVHRIPNVPPFNSFRSGMAWQKPLLNLSLSAYLTRAIKKIRPDIVHAHHYEALLASKLALASTHVPLVFHHHALFEPELATYTSEKLAPVASTVGRLIDRLFPRLAHATITVNEFNREQLQKNGISKDRLFVLNPPAFELPFPTRKYNTHPDTFIASYMGNLDHYQGLDSLIGAVEYLPANYRNRLRIQFITDSDYQPLLNTLRAKKLDSFFQFHSHGSFSNAWALLCRSHFSIIPRYLPGGIPIKLINCLAAGIPTIGDLTVCHGVNHNDEAYLLNTKDPLELAHGIVHLMKSHHTRIRLHKGGPKSIKRMFSPDVYVRQLDAIYQNLCSGSSSMLPNSR